MRVRTSTVVNVLGHSRLTKAGDGERWAGPSPAGRPVGVRSTSVRNWVAALTLAVVVMTSCTDAASDDASAGSDQEVAGDSGGRDDEQDPSEDDSQPGDDDEAAVDDETASPPPPEPVVISGTVVSNTDGSPLAGARVAAGDAEAITTPDGGFILTIESPPSDGPVTVEVERSAWQSTSTVVDDVVTEAAALEIGLDPFVVRGLRVSRYVASMSEEFEALLDLADSTVANTLIFDTKDETGTVLYETEVEEAYRLDAVDPVYDPAELLALADEEGLYSITRIVTFEDRVWSTNDPEAKLAGAWVDASNRDNWAYPMALAEEACQLGFDEIQFDYIRFPAGRTAQAAADLVPPTSEERAAVIAEFLHEAQGRLADMGCGVSAAIFGIVVSSETDEGIGQTPETVGAAVDAISPMVYPSHYGPGWLGFADPNAHPGPVVADALDDGMARMPTTTQMRPWIQAFYYNGEQIQAQIREAESRGAGWLLWNASGNYNPNWIPAE